MTQDRLLCMKMCRLGSSAFTYKNQCERIVHFDQDRLLFVKTRIVCFHPQDRPLWLKRSSAFVGIVRFQLDPNCPTSAKFSNSPTSLSSLQFCLALSNLNRNFPTLDFPTKNFPIFRFFQLPFQTTYNLYYMI